MPGQLRLLFSFILCSLLAGCHSNAPVTVSGVEVPTGLRKAANDQQFDYTGYLLKSLEGEAYALEKLFNFTNQLGTETAVQHGSVLAAVLKKSGDEVFSKALTSLPEATRQAVWAAMEMSGAGLEEMEFPFTFGAMLPGKSAGEYQGLYVFDFKNASFRDCAAPHERLIAIDKTGAMERNFRRLLRFPYPGQPIFAEVKGYRTSYYGNEHLPPGYTGFFIITEILGLEVKNYRNTCIPFDYWGLGSDPQWQLQISEGEGIIEFQKPGEERTKVFAYQPPVEMDSAMVYAAINESTGDNIRISVREEPCNDGITEIQYRYKIELTMNGEAFSGCGIPFGRMEEEEEPQQD